MKKTNKYDIKTLREMFINLDDNKGRMALNLLDKAEFMEATLKELQDKVKKDGTVVIMCQGNYSIERENPALKSYNTTIKNYSSIIKQLVDLLPKEDKSKIDSFEDFAE